MTSFIMEEERGLPTMSFTRDLYVHLLSFYAVQSHYLDSCAFEQWSQTFVPEGTFQIGDILVRGRKEIRRSAERSHQDLLPRILRRRHNIGSIVSVNETSKLQDRDSFSVGAYALVISTLRDGSVVTKSTFMLDNLILEKGNLMIVSREVYRDGVDSLPDFRIEGVC